MSFVFGYGRHSSHQQGITEEVQKSAVARYYEYELQPKGVKWGGWLYDAAESASKPLTERPEGLKLWAMIQPGDHVVWYKMDRAFRSTIDGSKTLELLKARSVTVHSLDLRIDTSTPLGQFFQTMMIAMAELELGQLKARTKDALAALKAAGRPYNRLCPMGYVQIYNLKGRKGTGRIEVCPVERRAIRELHERIKNGWTHAQAAGYMRRAIERGDIRSKRKWQKKTVSWALLALAYDFPMIFKYSELQEYAMANPTLRDVTVRLPATLVWKLYGDLPRFLGQAGPR